MSSNTENIPPQVIKKILKEISELVSEPPEGIKLISNEQDICDIQAVIEGPEGTPYAGGIFRIKLILCKGFPSQPPKGFFLTKIFHPNVGANGEICVNTLKKDWKPDLGIKHILLTVKCLLIVPNPESALNEEAGKLLLEDYDEYFQRAKLYTEVHARNLSKSLPNSTSDNIYASSSSSSSSSSQSTSLSTSNPLDSNKTINANTNNTNNNSNNSNNSDEPNMKMAKMSNQTKKNDKKKALKRL